MPSNRFSVLAPEGVVPSRPILSPDGRTIAFHGQEESGQFQVYTRSLSELEAAPVPGTEMASPQGFSPDGEWLLVRAEQEWPNMLRRVPVAGGPAFPITEHPVSFGAAWASDGTVIYGTADGLWGVPAENGGVKLDHRFPHAVPGAMWMITCATEYFGGIDTSMWTDPPTDALPPPDSPAVLGQTPSTSPK